MEVDPSCMPTKRRTQKAQSITSVSKVAGVSIATVSRVLNGHPHVAEATVRSVQEAMKKVGYIPREAGSRATNSGGTGNIAVLFPDVNQEALRTTLSGQLLQGIVEALRQNGVTMVVTCSPPDRSIPACIEQRKVDGVIIRGSRVTFELASLVKSIPCVWVFEAGYQSNFDVDMILEDNAAIGSMAANWLVKRGYKSLVVLDPIPQHPSFRVRKLFFGDAAAQLGVSVKTFNVTGDDLSEQVDQILQMRDRPLGIFMPGGDDQIVHAYRQMQSRGLELCRDFELICCNNDQHRLAALDPRLPNIDIQPELIGRCAVDALVWRLHHPDEERRRMVVSPKIIEGSPTPAATIA
jgi:LacI family transcriptional regulator